MTKALAIKYCFECYHENEGDNNWRCYKHKRDTGDSGIPEWCKLPEWGINFTKTDIRYLKQAMTDALQYLEEHRIEAQHVHYGYRRILKKVKNLVI